MSNPDEPTTPQPADAPPPPPVQPQAQYSGAPAYQQQAGQPYQQYQYGTQQQQQAPQYAAPREPSAFSALFDFRFQRYVTPLVAKFIYVLVMISAALVVLFGIIGGIAIMAASANSYRDDGAMYVLLGLGCIVGSLISAIIMLATYRIVLEFFVVQFNAAGHIRQIAERGERR